MKNSKQNKLICPILIQKELKFNKVSFLNYHFKKDKINGLKENSKNYKKLM